MESMIKRVGKFIVIDNGIDGKKAINMDEIISIDEVVYTHPSQVPYRYLNLPWGDGCIFVYTMKMDDQQNWHYHSYMLCIEFDEAIKAIS
jgi:hypothetical protein